MPNATIHRAIQRGAGELAGGLIENITYECYGSGGVALVVEAVTDNKNRTTSEIRHLLSKFGGRLGSGGSVLWMFESKGRFGLEEKIMSDENELALIDSGMDDMETTENGIECYMKPELLDRVKTEATRLGLTIQSPEIVFVPKQESLTPVENEGALLALLSELDALDDVTNVTTNAA